MAPAAPAPRYFVAERLVDALPAKSRVRLTGFLSALLARSWSDSDLYGQSIVVDAPRRELAEHCGTTEKTIGRWERELADVGVVRTVESTRRRRVLELVDPTFGDQLDRANRAVDNSGSRRRSHRSERDTGVHLRGTPVSTSGGSYSSSLPKEGESTDERAGRNDAASARPARTAQIDHEVAVQVARALLGDVRERFGRELAERGGKSERWTLSRGQATKLEASIAGRVSALRGSGAGSMAVALTKRDVERVVGYSVRAACPAAHLYRAIASGDWRSDPLEDSEAGRVRARGPAAEMPVRDVGRRAGPPPRDPWATPEQLERLDRALTALDASDEQRARYRQLRTSSEVGRAVERLEAAAMQREVARGASV
ncbi:MAG: hypothetical protein AAFU73_05455 [Planctomycetota bacterium]